MAQGDFPDDPQQLPARLNELRQRGQSGWQSGSALGKLAAELQEAIERVDSRPVPQTAISQADAHLTM